MIVEQYQCPQCYDTHDDKHDAQTCCPVQVKTVFVFRNGNYYDTEAEAREHVYLTHLQNNKPPLEARELADNYAVAYAS